MFGLFSKKDKNFDRRMPAHYEGIVTQKEYETILDYALAYLQQISEIVSAKDGTIIIKRGDKPEEEMQCHLDNLARRCKSEDPSEWQTIVNQHFARLNVDPHKAKYIFKDFDFAEPMIKYAVRHASIVDKIEEVVHRVDLPETGTFLVLDTDESFRYIRKNDIKEWEKTEKELFEIARQNVALEEIQIGEILWADKFEAYTFLSGDFSASFIVELEKNAAFAIGRYGAVVTIPSKGTAIVHPLNGATALDFIVSFYEMMRNFYVEDQVPITDKFYWYYEGRFELFIEKEKLGKMLISLPKKLEQLFKESPSV
jgi:Protein of unknown function (DUF1444)